MHCANTTRKFAYIVLLLHLMYKQSGMYSVFVLYANTVYSWKENGVCSRKNDWINAFSWTLDYSSFKRGNVGIDFSLFS